MNVLKNRTAEAEHFVERSELKKHVRIFNGIASIYNLFFKYQVNHYRKILRQFGSELGLPRQGKVLDMGCGTGALLAVFSEMGYRGTGVDLAERMLDMAKRSTSPLPLEFIKADITLGLPFADKSFDVVVSSYVLHGLSLPLREIFYQEARRVCRDQILFFDYNQGRRLTTDLVEWAEGGDYFNFIHQAEQEMNRFFSTVKKHEISLYAAIYQCLV